MLILMKITLKRKKKSLRKETILKKMKEITAFRLKIQYLVRFLDNSLK